MRTLDACPNPRLLLSFDFDGTLHDPATLPGVPVDFFTEVKRLRETQGAVWGINTGRSMPQVLEGLVESKFPFLPDWVVGREREIYFPNAVGRFAPQKDWNERCEKEITRLFKKAKKTLQKIRSEVEQHTGASYIEMKGEPGGLISRTEEEMEWIVGHIGPLMAEVPDLGWQRNSIYLRFGHTNYQKGSSLAEVARLYGIPTSHVFAMGDSYNDVEMLSEQYSGGAACPGNAVGAIRELILARGGLVAEGSAGVGVVEVLRKIFPENSGS